MDEIAAHVKADPVTFRLRHLRDPRLIDVVKAAAQTAKWQPRPSPRPLAEQRRRARPGHRLCALRRGQRVLRDGR